jgi:hypothetical protein
LLFQTLLFSKDQFDYASQANDFSSHKVKGRYEEGGGGENEKYDRVGFIALLQKCVMRPMEFRVMREGKGNDVGLYVFHCGKITANRDVVII